MPRSPTLQDVARKAGVHRSTVSLALRNSVRISEAVRNRVHEVANALGYRANPLVTALMCSRRRRYETKHVVLAYVTCHSMRFGWQPPHHDRPDYFPGAVARAEELGYKLEHFWLAEPGMTPSRFADILTNRGIHGMLIGRLPFGVSKIELPWERFSAVALGLTLRSPNLHRVAEDAFESATRAIKHCLASGHRRIGFVIPEPNDSPHMAERWLGAYALYQMSLAPEARLPVCGYRPAEEFPEHFLKWFEANRPDVLISAVAHPMSDLLDGKGAIFSRDVEVVLLANDKPGERHAGIHLDPAEIGGLAVDMLVGMMHRGEAGLPASPHHVLVPGQWKDSRVVRAGAG
jgi:DNA-binding LacI/PurR family transcriptional regulator